MKTKLLFVCALALVVYTAFAVTVTISISLTPQQLRGIQVLTGNLNNLRTNAVPPLPALSTTEFATAAMLSVLDSWADQARAADRGTVADKYNALSAGDRVIVDGLLK